MQSLIEDQYDIELSKVLQDTIELAVKAHAGQFDRTGVVPYITHPMAVMRQMKNNADCICAILHDVVEDTSISIEEIIERLELSNDLIETLRVLTHQQTDSYEEYIAQILLNERAIRVKIADIEDNLSHERSSSCTPALRERYENALAQLREGNIS